MQKCCLIKDRQLSITLNPMPVFDYSTCCICAYLNVPVTDLIGCKLPMVSQDITSFLKIGEYDVNLKLN